MKPISPGQFLLRFGTAVLFVHIKKSTQYPHAGPDSMGQDNNTVIVTGGAGYVGSHVVVKLCEAGYRPVIVDNFCNSSPSVVGNLEMLSGSNIEVAALDMRDAARLAALFRKHSQVS